MSTSTVPAFTEALLKMLRGRPAMKNVAVSDGVPTPAVADQREFVIVGDIHSGSQTAAAIGAQRREEEYYQAIHVWVRRADRSGAGQTAANERAYALMAEIEIALRADASVAGTVRWCQVEGGMSLKKSDASKGTERLAVLTQDLWVRARI